MSAYIGAFTFDCQNPLRLAEFWSAALGRPVDKGSNSYFATIGRGGGKASPAALFFLKVPEQKTVKNRAHVDLRTADREAEVAWLESIGARQLEEHTAGGFTWTVMEDPEGNEFCVGVIGPDDEG